MSHTEEFIDALNGGMGDLDAWLECNNEAECRAAVMPLVQQRDELLAALKDMLGGWIYIRQNHGDLYGVGWDRAQQKAEAAIANTEAKP